MLDSPTHGGTLFDALANTTANQLSIFKTDVVRDVIEYKWQTFARRSHFFGAFVHISYTVALASYINDIFLRDEEFTDKGVRKNPPPNMPLLYVMLALLIYPVQHDGQQMLREGLYYFDSAWNVVDFTHNVLGFANVWCQRYNGSLELMSKLTIIGVVATSLLRLFFFMRIIKSFSYIVRMLMSVISDLMVFLLFFAILILMFSLIFDIISRNPSPEYEKVGPLFGNLFTTLRLSLGDFDFTVMEEADVAKGALSANQHILFWFVWLITVVFSALIFLNFIIAEVSNSYRRINAEIGALVYKERAGLIQETESLASAASKRKNKKNYPRYIITREQDA
jgi:hypothetical protein